jgi:hypothetical protein
MKREKQRRRIPYAGARRAVRRSTARPPGWATGPSCRGDRSYGAEYVGRWQRYLEALRIDADAGRLGRCTPLAALDETIAPTLGISLM